MNSLLSSPSGQLVIYGCCVWAASLAGGWLLLALRPTHARLQTAASFVAGLMLSMALLHFVPHAARENQSVEDTARLVLAGFLSMFFLQRFFPHHHQDVAEGAPERESASAGPQPTLAERSAGQLSWVATTIGMTVHSLVGGVALAAAVGADRSLSGRWLGLGTALAIILHKPFDAVAVTTLMTASGCSRAARHAINVLFAFVTPLGAALFAVGADAHAGGSRTLLAGALAFCAGTFLCIAGAAILPEVQYHSHDRLRFSLSLAAGVSVAVCLG